MKSKSIVVKTVTGILLGTMILSVGVIASAKSKATNLKSSSKILSNKNINSKKNSHAKLLKSKLDSFVKAGTITQDQEDKIISYMKEKADARKAERDKVKNMTDAERKAYFQQKKTEKKSTIFEDLVSQNIISQSQADTISKSLPLNKGRHNKGKFNGFKKSNRVTVLKPKLDSLVKAGTITQDQEDKIISYMKEKADARKAERDKVKNMTDAERKAYFEQKKSETKPNFLKDLVSQNIISQSQADAIGKLLPAHK